MVEKSNASVVLTMCAISCAGMQLKAEDAKFELVLETWVCLKLLFGSIVRFCAILTRLKTYFLLDPKTLMLYICDEMLDQNLSIYI